MELPLMLRMSGIPRFEEASEAELNRAIPDPAAVISDAPLGIPIPQLAAVKLVLGTRPGLGRRTRLRMLPARSWKFRFAANKTGTWTIKVLSPPSSAPLLPRFPSQFCRSLPAGPLSTVTDRVPGRLGPLLQPAPGLAEDVGSPARQRAVGYDSVHPRGVRVTFSSSTLPDRRTSTPSGIFGNMAMQPNLQNTHQRWALGRDHVRVPARLYSVHPRGLRAAFLSLTFPDSPTSAFSGMAMQPNLQNMHRRCPLGRDRVGVRVGSSLSNYAGVFGSNSRLATVD
ncbi:hypothetical protein GSI_01461 [Ganoderma sinense ZZ0214-1]|uniref:Uncharacterized protein n=1 Tax=Ganoderma sinense ZZ0214-1 TaxID=1077348 RepID=A0A2G8SVH2_9APHY|nr:hypothetical protein GSI_01461 [Ganoderma sinense ZZ0214-1]